MKKKKAYNDKKFGFREEEIRVCVKQQDLLLCC